MKNSHSKLLITISLLFVSLFSFSQDMDQVKAMQEFKSGDYQFWRIGNGRILMHQGTRKITVESNDKKEVISFSIENNKYEPTYSTVLGIKKYTRTHFEKRYKNMRMIYYKNRIYIYECDGRGNYRGATAMIAKKKPGKHMKVFGILEEHNKEILALEKELIAQYTEEIRLIYPKKYYKKVYNASEGYKKVVTKEGKVGFLNAKNEIVVDYLYDDSYTYVKQGVIGVIKDKKRGYIDMNNKEVIKIEYDKIGPINVNLIKASKDNKHTLFSVKGKKVVSNLDYAFYESSKEQYYVRKGKDHGYVGSNGKIEWVYKDMDYDKMIISGNNLIVSKGDKNGLVSKSGKKILNVSYSQMLLVEDGMYAIAKGDKFGYYKVGSGFITELIYEKSNDKKEIKFANLNGSADNNGNISWFNKTTTRAFTKNQEIASWRNKYDNTSPLIDGKLTEVEKNEKIGFVNDNGLEIIKPAYENIKGEFKNGVVVVSNNYKYGVINDKGKVIVPLNFKTVNYLARDKKIKATKGGVEFLFDLQGNPLSDPNSNINDSISISTNAQSKSKDVGMMDGVSFVSYSAIKSSDAYASYQEPFMTNRPNEIGKTVFGTSEGDVIIVSKDLSSKNSIKFTSYNKKFNALFKAGGIEYAKGCEVASNKYVIAIDDAFYLFRNSSKKLVEVNTIKVNGNQKKCRELIHIGSNKVMSVWVDNEYNETLLIWDYVKNKIIKHETPKVDIKYIDKVTMNRIRAIMIDVNIDKTKALIVTNQKSNMVIEILDLKNDIGDKAIFPNQVYTKKHIKLRNIAAKFAPDNTIVVNYIENYKFRLASISSTGILLEQKPMKGLSPEQWTRENGNSMSLSKGNYIYFREGTDRIIRNPRTGKLYMYSRMTDNGVTVSYGKGKHAKRIKTVTQMPYLVEIDPKTLEWKGFDFVTIYANGKCLGYSEKYEGSCRSLFIDPIIVSTQEKTTFMAVQYSKKASFYWNAQMFAPSKGGAKSIASNTRRTNSSSSNSSSSNTSSNDNSNSSASNKKEEPKFSGSISLKNNSGEQVYCWISTGGSGWISKGGSKTFRCTKGAKVYLSDSNSSSTKKFAFKASLDICGKTVKVTDYR